MSQTRKGKSKNGDTLMRGTIFHLLANPFDNQTEGQALEALADGGLVFDAQGKVVACGDFSEMQRMHPQASLIDRSGCFILPGFIDCHIHMPQALMVGAFGDELLDWLTRHTRPEECKYQDDDYATYAARAFYAEELANGTTTALMFGPHFESAIDIAFAEAEKHNFRAIMGLTMEDRDLPGELASSPDMAYKTAKKVIEKWHGRGKLRYAVTPRFALTCTAEMLAACKQLLVEHEGLYFQTHLNENHREIARLKELFPKARNYLDVYAQHDLLGPRSFFHHSIYSVTAEIKRLSASSSRVVHCPSSNMFLGSGLMPLSRYIAAGVPVALGSDVGAGTGYGLFKEMDHAYKVQALLDFALEREPGLKLDGEKLLYLSTLAGARALHLEKQIGNFAPGRQVDCLIVDPGLDDYLTARMKNAQNLGDKLFLLAVLGGKHVITEVYCDGLLVHEATGRAGKVEASKAPATSIN